jgi:hypothetical protein
MNTQTVYKIVANRLHEWWSISNHCYRLRYIIGRKSTPSIGKIFVFKDKESAVSHFNILNHEGFPSRYSILEGEAENTSGIKTVSWYWDDAKLEQFWKYRGRKKKAPSMKYADVPKGTLVCDSFAPERVVGL